MHSVPSVVYLMSNSHYVQWPTLFIAHFVFTQQIIVYTSKILVLPLVQSYFIPNIVRMLINRLFYYECLKMFAQ